MLSSAESSTHTITIETPRWAKPLLEPSRYKGAKGGRGSGKSHFFAELIVEYCVRFPNLRAVCIREIQKSLTFSAKSLIESKIRRLGVSHLFKVTQGEIRRLGGEGIMLFQGMQDHTADSIKSLEGFHIAWVEEAQSLSKRSIELLRPTIRADATEETPMDSELWFSWNPDQPDDAIENLLVKDPPEGAVVVHVNFDDNPFIPETLLEEMRHDRRYNPDSFDHVWLGGYNVKSEAQIFNGKWTVDEFEPTVHWDGPYYGLDFGFSQDPTFGVECYIYDDRLYIYREASRVGLELDDTARFIEGEIPGMSKHTIRADCSRPESISYLSRNGLPKIEGVDKWSGSVEDGVEFLRSFKEIVIHARCENMQREARLYRYKVNKAGDILAKIEDQHNHGWDATRYALAPLIKQSTKAGALF